MEPIAIGETTMKKLITLLLIAGLQACSSISKETYTEMRTLTYPKGGQPHLKEMYLKDGKHNSYPSKAFDIAFKKADGSLDWSPNNFKNFAAIVKKTSPLVEWGGDWKSFKDLPHFQVA